MQEPGKAMASQRSEELIEIPERSATLHMNAVILWRNNMVMVFDDQGHQMCEYQGEYYAVRNIIDNIFMGSWEYEGHNGAIISYELAPRVVWKDFSL
jgi:hypothetical protein